MSGPSTLASRLGAAALVPPAFLISAVTAHAHHAMDGETPETLVQGLLSGLGHPIIGIDHLAGIVAVGLLSAAFARGALLPLAFVAASLLGAALHVAELDIPLGEVWVALSVVVLGGALAFRHEWPIAGIAALFALAGVFHGYAYGESIVGAEPTPLIAYFIGFAAIQYAIALAAHYASAWLAAKPAGQLAAFRYAPAAVIILVGIVFTMTAIGA
ncbi:MAG: HupE/UreJ family protein [Alphaproteobacteria bacterium]